MPCVDGELGKIIDNNYNRCLKLLHERKYDEELALLLETWDLIPDEKYNYDESYLIAWRVVQLAIETNNLLLMNKWKTHIALADPNRADSGEREMWLGKIAYMNNKPHEAKHYFQIADKKSNGRCFNASNLKYKDYMLAEENEQIKISSDSDSYFENDELDNDLHEKITQCCEDGDMLFDNGDFDNAIMKYDQAWDMLPEPKHKWDAASWIYCAKGDAFFFKNEYSVALVYFRELYNTFEMINEFVLIRYGQCLYETGQVEEGKRFIFEAYMLGGRELFIRENAKYFFLIESMI